MRGVTVLRCLALMVFVACASNAPAPQPRAPSEPAIAKVNGVVITRRAFDEELEKVTARSDHIPADRLARIADNILKRLIEEELIAQAVKNAKIVVPQHVLDEGLREYKERFQSEEQFDDYIADGRVTLAAIFERIRARKALEMLLGPRLDVPREDVRAFYDEHERFYFEKAGVHASHILIKVSEQPTADELSAANEKVKQVQAALAAGEDFTAVAMRMTEGPSRDGDVGWFGEGRMVKEFEDAAFKMKVGEISGPVRTRFGIHIIKLLARREDHTKTFEEVEPQIVASLQNKRFFTERRMLLDQLREFATIELFVPPEYQVPPADLEPVELEAPDSE